MITCAFIGSFSIAYSKAGLRREIYFLLIETSKRIRPAFTLQNQKSTLPLPRPIRTSFGFDVWVESG
jgi:hypothetical protein